MNELVDQQVDILNAAAKCVANCQTVVHVRLVLWMHDLEKNEQQHGVELVGFKFEVKMLGKSEIVCKVPQTPQIQKYLKTNNGIVLDGRLSFHLFAPPPVGYKTKEHEDFDTFAEGFGMPVKEDRNSLKFSNSMGSEFWNLEFEFNKSGVLSKFKFVHDTEEHESLEKYLFCIAKNRFADRIRQVCTKEQREEK
jgi:hypothetical protein